MDCSKKFVILEGLTLLSCFLIYYIWSTLLPVSQAPDEAMRLSVPSFILENGYLPHGADEAIRDATWGKSYAFSVYGSSLVAVVFMKAIQLLGGSQISLVIAARFANVLFASATVFICMRIGQLLFECRGTGILLGGLVGFLPQFAFLSSYLNSDVMGIFCTAWIIWVLIKGDQQAWQNKNCIYLGIAIGVCTLSYYFEYGIIIASIVFFYISIMNSDGCSFLHNLMNKDILKKTLIVIIFALLVSGWFFVRNFIIYDGDIFGMTAGSKTAELYAIGDFKPSLHPTPERLGYSPIEMLTGNLFGINWINSTVKSFIGMFGYMSIGLGQNIYKVYMVILAFGCLVGIYAFIKNMKSAHFGLILLTLLITIIIPIILSINYSWTGDYQPQGRYLMGALVPLMILVAKGVESVMQYFAKKTSVKVNNFFQNARLKHCSYMENIGIALCLVFWVILFIRVAVSVVLPNCIGSPL